MNHPEPKGELLYCTLQNLYYYSIQQQEFLIKNGQKPRMSENCTIKLSGPRRAGFTWALKQFLINDCENATVICPNKNMADMIWKDCPNDSIRKKNHIFATLGNPSEIKGYNHSIVIFSNYTLMKEAYKRKLQEMEDTIGHMVNPTEYKVLIHLH